MPPADTNVSHVALHDHRIRVQSNEVDRSFDDATEAKPILDISHLPAAERRRLMALAKYEIYRNHGSLPQFADYDNRAIAALIQIKQAGEATADVDAALAWLAISQGQTAIAERMSRELLRRNEQEAMSTIVATDVLARILFSRNDFQQALPLYRRLNDYHRNSRDRYFLGLVEQNTRNTDAAIKALRQSIEIDPAQVSAHAALHAILLSNGQVEEAEKHRKAAAANQLLQQRYQRPKEGARNQ